MAGALSLLSALLLPVASGFVTAGALRLPPVSPVSPALAPVLVHSSLSAAAADLASTAVRWGMKNLGDDVMLALASPHAYWLLRDWHRRAFGDQEASRDALEGVRRQLIVAGRSAGCDILRGASVTVRTKGLFSTFEKAVVRQKHVHDVLAVRVVLRKGLGNEACFHAHEAILRMWDTAPGRLKDYVSMPKANGYQAVHDTRMLATGLPFEVQIRTADMHKTAEFGSASHRRYKGTLGHLPTSVMAGVALGYRSRGRPWVAAPQLAF